MAKVQPKPINYTRGLFLSVYYKWVWADDWIYAPYFQVLSMTKAAAPAIGRAILKYRYGAGKWEDTYSMADASQADALTYAYIQIRGRRGTTPMVLWTGVVPAETFRLLGKSGTTQTADQIIEAQSLDILLQNRLDGAWVEPVGSTTAVWLDHLPVFNQRYEYGGDIIGNRSEWNTGKGSYLFAASGEKWTNYTIIHYLLTHYQAGNGPTFQLRCWEEIQTALNQIIDVYNFNNLTVRQALNLLINRSRGFSWTYLVDVEGNVELVPFSLLAEPITLGNITIPENRKSIPLDLWTDPEQTSVEIIQDVRMVYDKIIVRGARLKSCCSVQFTDDTLEEGWTDEEEAAYKKAAADTGGYDDLSDEEKGALNDKFRSTDRFHRVFTTFRVPRDWDWKVGTTAERIVNPAINIATGEPDTDTQAGYWNAAKRFINQLPFLVGVDYSASTPVDRNPENSEPEYRNMFVLVKDKEDKYQYADKLSQSRASVRPLTRELGVEMRLRPAYLAAKEHWDVEDEDTEPGNFTANIAEYGIDYEQMIVTGFIETDQHLRLVYQFNEFENPRVLIIDIPDAELWYITPDTIVDVNESGQLVKYGGSDNVLRDDTDRLYAAMAAARSWYGQQHNRASITIKAIDSGIPIGTLIRNLDITKISAIGSVVTSITWDCQGKPGTTQITTDFAELDIAGAFGSGGPCTLSTPSIQVAARKIEKTEKKVKEIKAQVDKTPLRIEPGTGGGLFTTYDVRAAVCTEDAPYDVKIKANLIDQYTGLEITSGEGSGIDVYFDIFARDYIKLDGCLPPLKDGSPLQVTRRMVDNEGTPEERWYCIWPFFDATECQCS